MQSSRGTARDCAGDSTANDGPTLERHLRGHKDCITAISFNPSMKQLVTSSVDCSLLLWNLENNVRAFRFAAHKEAVHDVAFSPSGNLLASASRDRTVRFWTPTVYGTSGDFCAHTAPVRSVHFSPDGKNIVTSSDDKTVKLWTVSRKRFVTSFSGHTNWVRCARFSHDGRLVASCADDKNIKLFDPVSAKCIHSFQEEKAHAVHLSWHPSGTCIGVALTNNVIRIYDVRAMKLVQHYRSHEKAVNQVAFHPSGDYLLSASDDATMKIIDVIEGRPIFTLEGHEGAVTAVTFSPDGQYFASAGVDKQVFVWKTNFEKLDWRTDHNHESCSLNETCTDVPTAAAQSYDARPALSRIQPADQVFATVRGSEESIGSNSSDDIQVITESLEKCGRKDGESQRQKNGTTSHVNRNGKGSSSCCAGKSEDCPPCTRVISALENVCGQLETMRNTVELMSRRLTLLEDKLMRSDGVSQGAARK